METQTEVIQVPPEGLLAAANIRFGLKESRVKTLMESILARGGVMEPLEVEPANGDALYPITDGAYRHEAVTRLNKEGAGLTLPCIVVPTTDPVERMRRQLEHNNERENMTLMDASTTIKLMFDAGMPRVEIREAFKRPGGRKGSAVQPASNSWVNMVVALQDLPKKVQQAIHVGNIPLTTANELVKIWQKGDKAKFDATIAEIEKEREKELEAEEKDEEKYLASLKKEQDAEAKTIALAKEVEDAKAKADQLSAAYSEKARAEAEAHGKVVEGRKLSKEEKEEAEAKFKEAQVDSQKAFKEYEETLKLSEKLAQKLETAKQSAEERKAAAAKKAKDKAKEAKSKPISVDEVKKAAAKAEVDGAGHQALKLGDVRDAVRFIAAAGNFPKVQAIGKALESCIMGVTTPKEMAKELAKITGEYQATRKGAKKEVEQTA